MNYTNRFFSLDYISSGNVYQNSFVPRYPLQQLSLSTLFLECPYFFLKDFLLKNYIVTARGVERAAALHGFSSDTGNSSASGVDKKGMFANKSISKD